jgi:protocatechuate 3,4-dioxygenase beta subunit
MNSSRRRFSRALLGLAGLASSGLALSAALPTPRQSAGPFYPDQAPADDDSDLTRVAGRSDRAQGEISDLGGRLLDRNGRPLGGMRIEIWQCDANGRYRHSRDGGRGAIDPGFQGFGHVVTDGDGRYGFRTIRPVPYPGRTPHIHVAVFPPGERPFVTQLYVAGDPRNDSDFLYRRIATERRGLVSAEFVAAQAEGVDYVANWDIVLGEA